MAFDKVDGRNQGENTLAIHPDIDDGGRPPRDGSPETIALDTNEPVRPNLRRYEDFDEHNLKAKGQGDLSKVTKFPDPQIEFAEYPKHVVKDGKTFHVAHDGADPVELRVVDVENKVAIEPQRIAVVDEPEDSKLTTEPIVGVIVKSSGIDGDAGDWTTQGDGTDYPFEEPARDVHEQDKIGTE